MDYFLMWFDNSFTVLLMVIGFILVLVAQVKIDSAYSKYRKVKNSSQKRIFGKAVRCER